MFINFIPLTQLLFALKEDCVPVGFMQRKEMGKISNYTRFNQALPAIDIRVWRVSSYFTWTLGSCQAQELSKMLKTESVSITVKKLNGMRINCFSSPTSYELFWSWCVLQSTLLDLFGSSGSSVLPLETYSMASKRSLVKWAINCKYQPFMQVLLFDKSWDSALK